MAYLNPNQKEFATKGAAIRYYFAQNKNPEKIAELSGVPLRNVNICLKADKTKGIKPENIDPKTGLLKAVLEAKKNKAEKKAKPAEKKAKSTKKPKGSTAAKGQNKVDESKNTPAKEVA